MVADARGVPVSEEQGQQVRPTPARSWRPSPAVVSYVAVAGLLVALIAIPLAIIVVSGILPGIDIGSFERACCGDAGETTADDQDASFVRDRLSCRWLFLRERFGQNCSHGCIDDL